MKTLFAHWRRYKRRYGGGFNLSEYLEVVFSNLISRFFGAIMRIFLIFVALLVEITIFVIGALFHFLADIVAFNVSDVRRSLQVHIMKNKNHRLELNGAAIFKAVKMGRNPIFGKQLF